MGRFLGAYDNSDDIERNDLNKCPDCGCFFVQDNCPVCGKLCPFEMRAGNRVAPKKKKKNSGSSSSRTVTFIDWYHSWWFIVLMLIFMPIIGLVLLFTSPHKKNAKIAVAVIFGVITVGSYFGIGFFGGMIKNLFDRPVDTSLSREEYISRCEEVSPEELYRNSESYKDKFVKVELTVKAHVTDSDKYYGNEKYPDYYVCTDGSGKEFYILVRDCIQDVSLNYIPGDVITVYGEVDEGYTVYAVDGHDSYTGPTVNAAYVEKK